MKRGVVLFGLVVALTSAFAIAQDAPESLLPPGFDDPAPPPQPVRSAPAAPVARPASQPAAARAVAGDSSRLPSEREATVLASGQVDGDGLAKLPTLEELGDMTAEEFAEALGLEAEFDIPAKARRSLEKIGIIDEREGGLAASSLAGQKAAIVRAVIKGNRGLLMSRWGHILLRRTLASRLDAPKGMDPVEFAALRAALLLRMGEAEAARSIVQDVDTENYSDQLVNVAFDTYVANGDMTGLCPTIRVKGGSRDDPKWQAAEAICMAFRGDGNLALSRLDRMNANEVMPKIDLLLAKKYAGSVGRARRAVTIEWDGVDAISPWRHGLAMAVGVQVPEELMRDESRRYDAYSAIAPMLGLETRAKAADRAAGMGVLSSAAIVDLYSQMLADSDVDRDWGTRAELLRDAYVQAEPASRLAAMQQLWTEHGAGLRRYSRKVLTAYAAARVPVDSGMQDSAADLVASMLAAGLDHNAIRWGAVVEPGGQAWALLALSAPKRATPVANGVLDAYVDDDDSVEMRRSAFLVAGLAGLGRITPKTKEKFVERLDIDLDRSSDWTRLINHAAGNKDAAMVSLLAALGMQGSKWDRMTPRYLYNIVSALRRVGLDAEARMIAAEAVARS